MDFTYYAFAFFVFLLVCAAIWFYSRVTGNREKKDKSSYEKEQRLFQMYQNIEDMLGSFEEYAEEAKADIEERLKQAEALINGVQSAPQNRPENHRAVGSYSKPVPEERVEMTLPKKNIRSTSDKPKNKMEDLIPQYLAKGMSKEEIAKVLGISSREISLIMEIKKIQIPGDKS